MSASTLLKLIESKDPDIIAWAKSIISGPSENNDLSILKKYYQHTHVIHTTNTEWRDRYVFIAATLKTFSPESLITESKVRNGICRELAIYLDCTQQNVTALIRGVRDHYSVNWMMRENVDQLVEKFKKEG